MEFEQMKKVWSQMHDQIDRQNVLSDKMIMMMTQEKYRNRLNHIAYPELLGSIFCYGMVILILLNFNKLDSWYNVLFGMVCISILLVIPVLSLKPIFKIRNINIGSNTYADIVLEYTKHKKSFQKSMKLGYYLCFVLMLVILPVTSKIWKGKDLFENIPSLYGFLAIVLIAIIGLILISKKVLQFYNINITAAEQLINELEKLDRYKVKED